MTRVQLQADITKEEKSLIKSIAYAKGYPSLRSFVIAALRAFDKNLGKLK